MRTREIAGQIMGQLEAFEGSKAAMDTTELLIVRGRSRQRIPPEELESTISQILQGLGAQKLDMYSDETADIITIMDEQIRSQVSIQEETDIYGIYRLKESFENMNCHADYGIGVVDDIAIFIILWKDKSGIGPLFVELVVSALEG
ncbi:MULTISPECIES: DUF2120 domain-containing protein [Methanobacterium]|jgi:hypothetical protein|uniref:DUF2120 domain-containing protein n=1 Tax=Methanobacterium formicicum TaxID=2162 RepID=A0A089ZFN5_METFO|nr:MULTISPECIES: DUF2120 domain-containing protein [Methanobacterium]AIS31790.1 hypothetical protein BRM9_0973 [Methanobacterium formicicum]KUK75703.1 MAG: Uncharacterized protein XD90_0055 [Methanobacterium sp. 42_16]MBF4475525.1 DUF2120 domain-containing protein [Methanobacterium formicicum]MDD4811139.1 DUF2120 domain-containing protein [Methanobacterium formicicum]MDG3548238.1 DUF2120 domain-containing protein [Methanobacterium formicicum]